MAVWLGIDYGIERCGLACTDPSAHVVFPLATLCLASYGNRKALLDAMAQLALKKNVQNLVLGLPVFEDGTENETCRQIRNVAKRIQRRLPLPLYFMPETLSSYEAEQALLATGCRGAKKKAVLDQVAACRILESFLAQPPSVWRTA